MCVGPLSRTVSAWSHCAQYGIGNHLERLAVAGHFHIDVAMPPLGHPNQERHGLTEPFSESLDSVAKNRVLVTWHEKPQQFVTLDSRRIF